MRQFFPLLDMAHVGTKMKDSQVGRFPSDHCRNDPDYPIGSHDSLFERSIIELCRKNSFRSVPNTSSRRSTQSLKSIFIQFEQFETLRGRSDE